MQNKIVNTIKRNCLRLRYKPIRVFVFHLVSEERDPLVCQEEDWTQLDQFKHNIEHLMEQYTFISLTEAYDKLQYDRYRLRKYAVLTTDDGLASVLNVVPWLEEKKIPLTLFINTRYMAGDKLKPVHLQWLKELAPDADVKAIAKRMYLSREQIFELNSPYIEIGLHGHEHLDAPEISEDEFKDNIEQCQQLLCDHPRYISAYAFPWGRTSVASMRYLKKFNILAVVVNGETNYVWRGHISRESIDNVKL